MPVYTDRHSIFEAHEKGQPLADPDAATQFGRALRELDVVRIRAHSRQAKGRVERSYGTAQDRWVKELRRARARTCERANAVLDGLLPGHNRRFAVPPSVANPTWHFRLSGRVCNVLFADGHVEAWTRTTRNPLPPGWPAAALTLMNEENIYDIGTTDELWDRN